MLSLLATERGAILVKRNVATVGSYQIIMRRFIRTTLLSASFSAATLLLAQPQSLDAETFKIDGPRGARIETEVHLPPDFDAAQPYSVLVSPGDYYWQDRPSQPGWIVVVSEGLWGDQRVANSKPVLDWLRSRYRIRHDGFHLAGWSANSAGVFEVAMTYPKDVLSVTGIAGMPGRDSEDDLGKLAGIHVQFIVGEKDRYWRQGSERWHELMQKQGISTTLEIVPKGEHVMPEIANEPLFERLNRLVEAIPSTAD